MMAFRTVGGALNGAVLSYRDADGLQQWIHVTVQKDAATGEFRARIMSPMGEKNDNADYYTDNKVDAFSTAVVMAKAIWERHNHA